MIGQLYRTVLPKDYHNVEISYDQDLEITGWAKYKDEANIIKRNYNYDVISLMNQFGIKTEVCKCLLPKRR